jgi:hypothetical protein
MTARLYSTSSSSQLVVHHLEERLLGVYHLDIDDGVHPGGRVVLGDDLLLGNVEHLGPQVHPDHPGDEGRHEVETWVQPASVLTKNDLQTLLVGLDDDHRLVQGEDQQEDYQYDDYPDEYQLGIVLFLLGGRLTGGDHDKGDDQQQHQGRPQPSRFVSFSFHCITSLNVTSVPGCSLGLRFNL